jgi:hypothetical protein
VTAKGDHTDFVAFSRRILRALARRMAVSDPEDLTELLALRDDLDTAIDQAVAGLRASGYSWADIARGTGTTRQAAFARCASKCH